MDLPPQPPAPEPAANPTKEHPAPRCFYRRGPVLLGAFGFLALLGVFAWAANVWWRKAGSDGALEAPADPRLTYPGPFRNIHPDVKYVGDAACVGCHPLEVKSFHQHPMARSVVPVRRVRSSPPFVNPTPFEGLGTARFDLQRRGDRLFNRERRLDRQGKLLAEFDTEVAYVIGSGQRGYSFLAERDGYVFQTSISWYSQKRKWDLSPGFQSGSLREVVPECLFCHAGAARPVEHTINRYQKPIFTRVSIGCERCHGPGELHVRSRRREELPRGIDPTIVNPRYLDPELKEHVCQQCHLQGATRVLRRGRHVFDYRPGLPLNDFWSVYVRARQDPAQRKAVSHVELMHQSKCFQASPDRMGCTTCHDPHEQVQEAQRVTHYREKCLECHAKQHPCTLDRASRLKRTPQDSCIDCHMPRFPSADIAHTAPTDHSIPRRPGAAASESARGEVTAREPLVPFHRRRPVSGPDADRDLGQALMQMVTTDPQGFVRHIPRAQQLLEAAEARLPRDVPLLLRLAESRVALRRFEGARAALERVLALAPEEETGLRLASFVSLNLKRPDDALRYCDRAIALNPWHVYNYFQRAVIQIHQKDWRGALATCRRVLRRQPTLVPPHVIMAYCHENLDEFEQAAAQRERAQALGPAEADRFRATLNQVLGP